MNHTTHARASAGFSLLEMLIAAALVAIVMIGLLQLLDGASRVSKIQNDMAQMTETLRFTVEEMVSTMRMAGTGGLPLLAPGAGSLNVLAVNVQDNVAAGGFSITDVGGDTWTATPGSDVLTIRGVIGGELYDLQGATQITGYTGAGDSNFSVRLTEQSPFTTGRVQPLPAEVTPGTPLLFTLLWELPVVVGTGQTRFFSKYNIGIVDTVANPTGTAPNRVLDLSVDTVDTTYQTILDLNEGGDFEPFQQNYVITAGFMDDLIYFVSTNVEGEPALFLWQQSDNTVVELVDHIAGLQVALGIDLNNDGLLGENGTAANDDEWFYNTAGDTAPTPEQTILLQEVRVSLTGRTAHPDLQWNAVPELPENAPAVTGDDRFYRYRSHSVRVTLRSHPPLT